MVTRLGSADSRRHYATTPRLIEMLDAIFQAFRRRSPMALPEFVLYADGGSPEGDEAVRGSLAELRQELRSRGVPFAAVRQSALVGPTDGGSPMVRALRVVQALGGKPARSGSEPYVEPHAWRGGRRQYGQYTFPRSELLLAIENVVREAGPDAEPDELLHGLNRTGWRPGGIQWTARLRDAATDASRTVPALLIAVVAVLITDKPWYVTLLFLAVVMAALLALSILPGRAPVFLGLRREVRWFLSTTYLNQGPRADRGEGLTWRLLRLWPPGAVRQRVAAVARDIQDGGLLDEHRTGSGDEDAQRRHLQLRVHALREDLRDAHRAWSLDLRGRKRPTPPVLVLPDATPDNGLIELVRAISDIRSIRSELDPLLVIAAVRHEDIALLQRSYAAEPAASHFNGSGADLPAWYASWNRARRVSQSPSLEGRTLPWVLRVPLPEGLLLHPDLGVGSPRRSRLSTGRPRWTWLWSLPALALVLVATGLGLGVRDHRLTSQYCSSDLRGANQDTRRVETPGGKGPECVGVATGGVTFPVARQLQELIREENESIGNSGYVTLVYAGPLSGPDPEGKNDDQLVKGFEELRGAYIAQHANNASQPVKLRLLVANGGTDMASQAAMAERIVDVARRDRTIVGVVGIGRDMTDTDKVLETLRQAELPVVSGTNSGTWLLDKPNFFNLAATDQWQVRQLRLLAKQLRAPGTHGYGTAGRAVVLGRSPVTHDRYTREQMDHGARMLTDVGYRVDRLERYELSNGRPVLGRQVDQICQEGEVPRVVYFAGRTEDVNALMDGITSEPGCNGKQIAVLAGDDLSQAGFDSERSSVAANVTLYHLVLTAPGTKNQGTIFVNNLRKLGPEQEKIIGLSAATPQTDSALSDGQTMLMHDATEVLYRAATGDGQPRGRAEAWSGLLRTNIDNLATGRIDFTAVTQDNARDQGLEPGTRDNYAISLVRVANTGGAHYDRTVLCSRRAGDRRPLTEKECDVHRKAPSSPQPRP
ncbi:ABC transporter substrate-binding protein [Streptomyces griseoluteus]|uniref:ABC transporter substrate-binding protein n=1 Tax=Streptomyces griseoluteus TaxID=29306 RepID=A0A4Z1DEK1_STRGP|nr:ABC transporter substrate-binding protein [Streptomyces griseoluteus]TGN80274.1 ABC transporter substrate-binding protein [Streptomyces griseoluteus]